MKNIVMFSGGKDSTAQLFLMIENNVKIDEIVMCDLGYEFPEMYDHVKLVEEKSGMKITIIKPEKPLIYWFAIHFRRKGKRPNEMFLNKNTGSWDILTKKEFTTLQDGTPAYKDYVGTIKVDSNTGYGWPDMGNRWCTTIKVATIKKYMKNKGDIVEWHGIACDEPLRLERNKGRDIRYILNELKCTEQMALDYCYSLGFHWNGLYKHMKRVSCYMCPLQSNSDLRYLYNERPKLWENMRFLDSQSFREFKANKSLKQIENGFDNEKLQLSLF